MQWFFAITLFVSATLLFLVQPMFARMVLPQLGGSPAVWNTCMVFYQGSLLAGYVYAHLSIRWLGVRHQAALHLAILCLPWLVLPISTAAMGTPPVDGNPTLWLLAVMFVSVGLPFFVVSASAPMLQAWFADTGDRAARDPYFLYAASNLGSMIALLGYPLVVEPAMSLAWQSTVWAAGYGLLAALILGSAVLLWRSPGGVSAAVASQLPAERVQKSGRKRSRRRKRSKQTKAPEPVEKPALRADVTWPLRMRWLVLSFAPSSLLLGVTAHISTDIAAVPLLWVIPLALYLLTFVLVFARRSLLPHAWMVRVQPPLVLLLAVLFFHSLMVNVPWLWLLLHLATFFVTAMVCHGELAQSRPDPEHLTEFYLWISVGGVLGGAFNALVAPGLFTLIVEYPVVIVLACMLRPAPAAADHPSRAQIFDFALPAVVLLVFGGILLGREITNYYILPGFTATTLAAAAIVAFFFRTRPLRFALGTGAILLLGGLQFGHSSYVMAAQRNFFGVVSVEDIPTAGAHKMFHGSTNHGLQWVDDEHSGEPLTYYHRNGPLGQVFDTLNSSDAPRQIGITGLGAGSAAAYGKSGWRITYYEINPAVVRFARDPNYFTFLADSKAEIDVVLGDARITMAEAPNDHFDLLILDAFSSDSIPVHLLTREAVELYLDKLSDGGMLAFHISNRYLNLEPVLGNIAAELGLTCRINRDLNVPQAELDLGRTPSIWVVMSRRPEDLGKLSSHPNWRPVHADPDAPLWTDDYSNIISIFTWIPGM